MENIILQKTRYLKALMLTMLVGFFAFEASAQTITVDNAPAAGTYYLNDDASVEFTTTGTFTDYTIYLHTGPSTNITEDEVIETATDGAGVVINYAWDQVGGPLDYNLTAAKGSFETETVTLDGISSIAGGTDVGGSYDMDGVGLRTVTTQPIDLSGTDQMFLNVNLDATSVQDANPLRVQFSTDAGNTWTDMTDTNTDNSWSVSTPAGLLTFELTSGMKTASTQFRVIQEGKSDYLANEDPWTIFTGGGDYEVTIGGLEVLTTEVVDNYTVVYPETTITFFNDDADNPVGNYYAGQDVEIEGTFTGATGQVDDYNYTAVFENGNERFLLEGQAGTNNVNDISITGTVPADIDYGLNWEVQIVAFTGATPTLGLDRDLDGGLERFGYNGEFDGDEERYAISEMLNIQSLTNGVVLLDLSKTSNGLAASGTEIVLEYTTDGTTFTQIGSSVSLNDDLTEPIEFDISGETGMVSNSVQLRVRQLSNSGLDLDTWEINNFEIFAGGNVLFDQEIVDYNSSFITILEPTIALEPVDVPNGLIYPGDEVDLTYNITDGVFPAGTEIMAYVSTAAQDYMVGTSTLITPGAAEDHTISITVPPLTGGTYDVYLVSSTFASSNTRSLPIYNTTLDITEVTSDNGVIDGTTDVIYPGDNITANYTIDGSVGTGAELILEVKDFGMLSGDASDDEWVVLSSATGADIDGAITGELPANLNYDDSDEDGVPNDNPELRIRIGNGVLTNGSSSAIYNFYDLQATNQLTTVFPLENIEGNDEFGGRPGVFALSGERSATSVPLELPVGGDIEIALYGTSAFNGTPQTLTLSASNDGGATFEVIAEEEFDGNNVYPYAVLPQNLWGDEVIFKLSYNEDEAAAEFENELRLWYINVNANTAISANSATFDFSGQFRKPTVSLEVLTNTTWTVGEAVEIEYTTEGPFPANTEFALVFDGMPGTGADEFFYGEVVATSDDFGSGTFTFNVPEIAYSMNGMDQIAANELFEDLRVVAYDASAGEYELNEEIMVNMDEQFLVIEGNDDNPTGGEYQYYFNEAGDRSLLTTDFDLSSADAVTLEFDFQTDNGPMENSLTIPQLQTSIDAGNSFQQVVVDEENMVGSGYLYMDGNTYSVSIDPSAITEATHFRWYQALNGGAGDDEWGVENIRIILQSGNEITTYYVTNNSPVGIQVNHPSLGDFELAQVDPNDAVFNGESVDMTFTSVYESTVGYPTGVNYEFSLSGVEDPETGEDVIIASTDDPSTFTAEIPFYVTNGNYIIDVTITKEIEGETYYYEDQTFVGSLEVFLRVAELEYVGDPNATIYAGQDVTFNVNLENDETNPAGIADLYRNLILTYDPGTGPQDWLLAAPQSDEITVALPPFVTGNRTFRVELTEGAPIAEIGTVIDNNVLGNLEDDTDNFINSEEYVDFVFTGFGFEVDFEDVSGRRLLTTRDFEVGELTDATFFSFELDFDQLPEDLTANQYFIFEYSTDGGATYTELASYPDADATEIIDGETFMFTVTSDMKENATRLRWRQEETKGDITLNNVGFNFGETVPFDYISTNLDISPQALLITSLDKTESCVGEEVVLNYEVRGRFGADNVVSVLSSEDPITTSSDFEVAATDLDYYDGTRTGYATIGASTYPITFDGDRQREVRTNPDVDMDAGADIVEVVIDATIIGTLANPIFVYTDGSYVGQFNSDGVHRFTVSSFNVTSDTDIQLYQNDPGSTGDQPWVLNSIGVEFTYDANAIEPIAQNIVEGTGTINVDLLSNLFDQGDSNTDIRLRLQADDDTYEAIGEDFEVTGPLNEIPLEVIAPADIDADFTLDDQQACDIEDVMFTISNPQDYFIYQAIDAVTGDPIGDPLTYDPEMAINQINIGALAEGVRVGLQVTAASSTGETTCGTITSTVERDFFVQPDFELFNGSATGATRVTAGTTVELCGSSLTLRAAYYDANGNQVNASASQVNWYRDNLQTPVGSNAFLSTFNKSGNYFAQITDGNCTYLTEEITVNVAVRPEQPAITVVSGDLVSCDENNEVVLEGPAGFATYVWNLNGNTLNANQRTVTVSTAGTYQLQVSNATEANNCNLSNNSEPVIVNTVSDDDVNIDINGFTAQEGQVYDICDNNGTTISVTGAVGANANIKWFQDGAEYAANTNTNGSVNINVSGAYYAEVTAGECVFTTPEVTFNVLEAPQDAPTITATGDLTFCDGRGSVVLEGPEGFGFYQWNGPGLTATGATTSNSTIEVTQDGTYTLQVGNVSSDGAVSCLSPVSNTITVNSRTLPSVPTSVSIFDNACGDGPITFVLNNSVSNNVSYQLINAADDQPSGVAVTGNGNGSTYLTSDVLTEETTFYIEATYADGSGCTVSYPETRTFSATPNNVTLEVQGAQLIANYNGSNVTVRWYRDGVLLTNATSNSITITDAAEYSVEVEYASGCIVTASSADIDGRVLANREGMDMQITSYPNPAQSDITLNVNSQYMGKHEVTITSMTGQVMMQSSFEKSGFEAEHAMDVANLQEGIYNVQIRHNGLTQNVRIIKK